MFEVSCGQGFDLRKKGLMVAGFRMPGALEVSKSLRLHSLSRWLSGFAVVSG